MKNKKRILAMVLVLVFMFTAVMSSAVFAAADNGKGGGKNAAAETEKVKDNEKVKAEKTEKTAAETEDSTEAIDAEETDEEKIVKEKDKVMDQKKELKKQLIEARKSGNAEAEAQLLTQINEYKEQLKQMVKDSYTEEETAQLELAAAAIEAADPALEVLPVEKVIAKGRSLKLDMPPVIKDGKVLIPVRAFSQAYGAEVQWNQEEHTVTIIKDGIEIVLETDSSIVYVNGVETDLGMPVKGINGRTVMTVGFLAEKLGLKVEVDEEDGTVEIDEDEEAEEETEEEADETTTGN